MSRNTRIGSASGRSALKILLAACGRGVCASEVLGRRGRGLEKLEKQQKKSGGSSSLAAWQERNAGKMLGVPDLILAKLFFTWIVGAARVFGQVREVRLKQILERVRAGEGTSDY